MDGLRQKMSALTPFSRKHKVTVIGSGNWGSTIAKLVAENTATYPELFERDVQMWVYEENVEIMQDSKHYNESSELCKGPVKLTRVINELHENIKYLPEIALPENLIANPDIKDAVKDSTILIFNMPHQFIEKQCSLIKGQILPFARGISCIKGVNVQESSVSLFSETIGKELGIYCGALSGANIANEVAQEKFSETTIAYDPPAVDSQSPTPVTSRGPSPSASHVDLTQIEHKDVHGKPSKVKLSPLPAEYHPIDHSTLKKLFHRRYFHVRVVSDVAGVSLGGALKNIIALAAGWVDGLGWGDNAKAAVMRVGLLEMLEFGKRFFSKTVHAATFTEESAGVADLITTCNGGRHLRCARKSILEGKSIAEIEARDLNGQKLQGTLTAYEVQSFLKTKGAEKDFPLMTAVYNILEGKAKPEDLPDLIEPDDETVSCSTSTHRTQHESATAPTLTPSDLRPANRSSASTNLDQDPDHSTTTTNLASEPRHTNSILIPPPPLASSRYNRQLLLPQISLVGQERILSSRVLIVGLGGLGSPAAVYLAGAGVGTLGFVDGDVVEKSNLHRQIVHREDSVADPSHEKSGMSKAHSAIRSCYELNSEISYVAHEERLSVSNALEIIERYDLVLDCTDNPATRYLISDACVVAGKTLISGAAQRLEGQLVVLNYPLLASSIATDSVPTLIPAQNGLSARNPQRKNAEHSEETPRKTKVDRGPCYRCIFPYPPAPEMVQTCSEIGILGPVVGCIGTLMASEALRLIVQDAHLRQVSDVKDGRKSSMLLFSAWPSDPKTMFRTITLAGRRKGCVSCGEEEVVRKLGKTKITREVLEQGRLDYQAWCGVLEDINLLGKERRVSARDFLNVVAQDGERGEEIRAVGKGAESEDSKRTGKGVVIDVREENEWILGAKVKESINIPISKILKDPTTAFEALQQLPGYDKQGGTKVGTHQVSSLENVIIEEKNTNTNTNTKNNTTTTTTNNDDDNNSADESPAINQTTPPLMPLYMSMYFICHRGNDSQIAAQKLIDLDHQVGRSRGWIGDVEGGFVAIETVAQMRDERAVQLALETAAQMRDER